MKYQELEEIIIDEINDMQVLSLFDKMVPLINSEKVTKWAAMTTCILIISEILKTVKNNQEMYLHLVETLKDLIEEGNEKPS